MISDSSTTNGMDWDNEKLPLLVYVAREKRPSHPHHFKAGALNVLVSSTLFDRVKNIFSSVIFYFKSSQIVLKS